MPTVKRLFPALLIFFVLVTAVTGCQKKSEVQKPDTKNLQNGDLIFRRGRSAESQLVLLTDRKSNFSHVGIIFIEDNTAYVIHAVPGENNGGDDYLKKEKLSGFLAPEKASVYSVYRSDLSKNINEKAARLANLFYHKKLVFDNKYDLSTDDKLYCTELILKVFQQASNQSINFSTSRLPVPIAHIELIMPGNITENIHFKPVINP